MKSNVKVMAGVCGMLTEIRATSDDSDCKNIQNLARELEVVNPFEEIAFRGEGPSILRLAAKHCKHAACPVASGIIKAIEVASGLALPKDAVIQVTKAEDP
jgi:hypothetical protein